MLVEVENHNGRKINDLYQHIVSGGIKIMSDVSHSVSWTVWKEVFNVFSSNPNQSEVSS